MNFLERIHSYNPTIPKAHLDALWNLHGMLPRVSGQEYFIALALFETWQKTNKLSEAQWQSVVMLEKQIRRQAQ